MRTASTSATASVALPVGRLVGVGAVVFFANAAMLVLQLVAGRLLSPFIGSSLETWTSIIGVFLAGIALGNGFGGKLADRYPTPRTLAVLLGVGALAALWMLLFPNLLASTGIHKSIPLGARIPILAAALCLPAALVLSLLTPLAIKLGLPDVAHTGRVAGLIFALSTLGCLLGNYVTGFYLIPMFFINTLVLASAAVLLALAVLALVVVRPTSPSALTEGKAEIETRCSSDAPEVPAPDSPRGSRAGGSEYAFSDIRRAYLIVFLASFCGMALELTASRVLAQYLGVSLFTWTGIIGVMLAGTALGNFTGGQLADRPKRTFALLVSAGVFLGTVVVAGLVAVFSAPDSSPVEHALGIPTRYWVKYASLSNNEFAEREMEIRAFKDALPELLSAVRTRLIAGMLVGGALGALLAYGVFGLLVRASAGPPPNPRTGLAATLCCGGGSTVFLFVTMALITRYHLFDLWDPIVQVLVWTFSMFFLPMFALGMVSPQVIRLAVPNVSHAGEVAGRVYAWSTTGAIVGTFAAGYVLLSAPWLGMYRTVLCAALVLALTSLLVVNFWKDAQTAVRSDGKNTSDTAGSGTLLYLFSIVMGGIFGGFLLTGRANRDEGLVVQVESNYYTIKVSHDGEHRKLTLDALVHSSVDLDHPEFLHYTHEYIQMEFLYLARAGSDEPKALVIGGGGYTFPRYAMEMMPEARVDVVEIDPKVTEVAREYLGLKDYPGLRAIHMDGRQYVAEKVPPGTYDLVIQDAVNDLSVPAHLMTKEYNDAVKATLRPDGVYLLTIIDSIAYGKLWKAAMATLCKTFPAENVVLLTAEAPPNDGSADGYWDQSRRVLVIYASDKPFNLDAIRGAVATRGPQRFGWVAATVALDIGPLGLPGGGPAPHTARLATTAYLESSRRLVVRTVEVPAERLKPYTDREAGVVLTDQFCPVDNLMAEVFRQRYK